MVLHNHIAYRFLTDDTLMYEAMAIFEGKNWMDKPIEQISNCYDLLYKGDLYKTPHKVYLVTNTVIDKLALLHVTKKNSHFDWSVFGHLPDCKKTFIFLNNEVLRILVRGDFISFCHLSFSRTDKQNGFGNSYWVMFYFNRRTNELCSHFEHSDVTSKEEFIYKLLCFIFLSENTEEVVSPGRKHGTKKKGKFINELDVPVTIINSKWNITSIRTEGFPVSGHFRLQPTGPERKITKMIWINPFEKKGYVRKSPSNP